jgi:phosphoglucosamine mutase
VAVEADAKRGFYTNSAIRAAIEEAKAALGSTGRIVVRPSGTEPLIRVMAEGEEEATVAALTKEVAAVIRQQLA